jgi:hypothetical protein
MQSWSQPRLRSFKPALPVTLVFPPRYWFQSRSESMLHCKNSVLCFHNLTNCFSRKSLVLITIRIARGRGGLPRHRTESHCPTAASDAVSNRCKLLARFFDTDSFVFSNLQSLGCKTGGYRGAPRSVGPQVRTSRQKSLSGGCYSLRWHGVVDAGDTGVFLQQVLPLLDD